MTSRSAVRRLMTRQVMRVLVMLYRRSGGRVGGSMSGAPVLLLTTTGRRSGTPWTNPVIYQRDGRRIILVASNSGSDRDPAWLLNLRSAPDAVVELGRAAMDVTASEAADPELARLWALMVAAFPAYDDYVTRTSRRLPVIVLEPADR